jgi:periplasmic protein TonB
MMVTARRSSLGAVVSIAVHGVVLTFLVLQPGRERELSVMMNLTIESPPKPPPKAPPSPPPPPPAPDPAPALKTPRTAVHKTKAVPKTPSPSPEPAPAFDLGESTFAMEGGAWGLRPSEGDSTLGAFAAAKGSNQPHAHPAPAARASGFKPIPATDLTRRPEPEHDDIATPPYPVEAKRNGIEGVVVLRVEITKEGRVRSARIVEDPGGGLGAAAHAAMLRESWRPALDRRGTPVDTVITYSYRFVLEG